MGSRSRSLFALAWLVVALVPPSLAQVTLGPRQARALARVWTVDQAGGPGADFVTLPEAVRTAASGDVLLLRAGTYQGVELRAKGLTIVGDGAVPSVSPGLEVRDLPAGEQVVLRSLMMVASSGLSFESCAGSVWLEDCTILEGNFLFVGAGLELTDCADVVLVRTAVTRPPSSFVGGGAGLLALRSQVHAFQCTFEGTSWLQGLNGGPTFFGDPGGDGARLQDSFLYAVACTFSGGQGEIAPCDEGSCLGGGNGGAGLDATAAATNPVLLACTFAGGLGGEGDSTMYCISCAKGTKGPNRIGPVTIEPLPLRSYTVESPVHGGAGFQLTADCEPGEQVWSILSTGLAPSYVPLYYGTQVGTLPALVVFEGLADGSGVLTKTVPIPPTAALAPFGRIFAQGLFFDASGFAYLGTPSVLVVVP